METGIYFHSENLYRCCTMPGGVIVEAGQGCRYPGPQTRIDEGSIHSMYMRTPCKPFLEHVEVPGFGLENNTHNIDSWIHLTSTDRPFSLLIISLPPSPPYQPRLLRFHKPRPSPAVSPHLGNT